MTSGYSNCNYFPNLLQFERMLMSSWRLGVGKAGPLGPPRHCMIVTLFC